MQIQVPLLLTEQTAPSSPGASQIYLYAKSDDKIYIKNSGGTETDLTATGTSTGASKSFVFFMG